MTAVAVLDAGCYYRDGDYDYYYYDRTIDSYYAVVAVAVAAVDSMMKTM